MEGNYRPYDHVVSADRIKEILDQPQGQFQEVKNLPSRDELTFTNGFYGYCSAVFVDIRDSSGLTEKHTRPRLAKIYRSFVSEMVAVLNSCVSVREVNIVGDCVWAVYNTPQKDDIDEVFSVSAKANSLIRLLNFRFSKEGIDPIKAGIGVDYGRVLMVKAGYKGSAINDVIYMGDVVNRASHLANVAGKGSNQPIFYGGTFQQNLKERSQNFLQKVFISGLDNAYSGNIVETDMTDWLKEQA